MKHSRDNTDIRRDARRLKAAAKQMQHKDNNKHNGTETSQIEEETQGGQEETQQRQHRDTKKHKGA